MSNKPTLDEILTRLELKATKAYREGYKTSNPIEYRAEAKQQLIQLIADIIGEDEAPYWPLEPKQPGLGDRNLLRTEQRLRASERGIDLK